MEGSFPKTEIVFLTPCYKKQCEFYPHRLIVYLRINWELTSQRPDKFAQSPSFRSTSCIYLSCNSFTYNI